jgi:hypothetical protein
MSAFYEIHGTVRLRRCHEVNVILARLDEYCMVIDLAEDEHDPDVIAISIDSGNSFSFGSVLDVDELLKSLGPYTVEPAVFATRYENEAGELVVAPTEEADRATLSKYRLEQIEVLLHEVTPEDWAKLADKLRSPQVQ